MQFRYIGTIFKFYPEEDRTEYVTENWGEKGYYTANLAMSPGGRYLYYLPGLSSPQGRGIPIVQFDTHNKPSHCETTPSRLQTAP